MDGAHEQDYVAKAQVVADHSAIDASQLDLRVGDIVYVLEKDDSGWWGGHKEGQDATGWFPFTVVRVIGEPEHQVSVEPHHADATAEVVPQYTTSSSAGPAAMYPNEPFKDAAHDFQSTDAAYMTSSNGAGNALGPKLDIQESHHSHALQTQVESPTRKARWPASPQVPQGQHNLKEATTHREVVQSNSTGSREQELMELKDTLKKERSKHMEELTVERGRRESLEANKQQHSAQIARMQDVQEDLKRQNQKLEKENADLRMRVHSLETAQPQHSVGNEAEQLRRLQEQVSLYSRQAEKIWHAVEKNVSPAMLMKIKADAPEEPAPQANLGGPPVEVARRLFSGGVEGSPSTRARADAAFAVNAHPSDSWAKPPTVPTGHCTIPKSAPLVSRPAVSSREGTPVKLSRPYSCTDLEPEEAPAKGAVANIVRKLERCCSTPPSRTYEQGNTSRGRSPANSEKVLQPIQSIAWGPPLQLDGKNFGLNRDGYDNDEPVNFGMSPISTARAQLAQEAFNKFAKQEIAQEAFNTNKGVALNGNEAARMRSPTPTPGSASASSLVRNRIRQLENGC
eukprot:gnl/MRDRNA2_/MRDRNA2_111263_c0_seq1.p1 gnl/MRDRNA2_/MRDRNA2_111263_c0~~gnl/MRDRNA2_/MRDRNA2_111263_c0_seq1.p1  ORF type:complete len:569 (+),score=149.47 gnl/MRDRNA2_/MRDRNA2_111263_c0_seq1:86-1792(+)